jgi:hypothetical protein
LDTIQLHYVAFDRNKDKNCKIDIQQRIKPAKLMVIPITFGYPSIMQAGVSLYYFLNAIILGNIGYSNST